MIGNKAKKSKMFLAVAVIAALAAVSIAGVALQDDEASAAGQYFEIGQTPLVVIDDGNGNVNFFITADDGLTNIELHGQVTGTINIGYYLDTAHTQYEVIASLTLTGVENVILQAVGSIDINGDYIGVFFIDNVDQTGDTLPAGEFVLEKGTVTLGAHLTAISSVPVLPADFVANGFNGTVKAGDFSAAVEWTYGLAVSYDGTDAGIVGSAGFADPTSFTGASDVTEATVSLSGPAKVYGSTAVSDYFSFASSQRLETSVDVVLTVEEGAEITVGDVDPETATATVAYDSLATVNFVALVDANGNVDYPVVATGTVTLTDVKVGEPYSLYLVIDNFVYAGSITVNGNGTTYNVALGPNTAVWPATAPAGDFLLFDSGFSFNIGAAYTYRGVAIIYGDSKVAEQDGNKLTFENVSGFANNLFILLDKSAYYGPISGADVNWSTQTITNRLAVGATVPASGIIVAGNATADFSLGEINISGEAVVKGALIAEYKSNTYKGVITVGAVNIEVSGEGYVQYGTQHGTYPSPANPLANKINAAYYTVDSEESVPLFTTFYYKTLANALRDGGDVIHITGLVIITEDITFPENKTIIIDQPGSKLQIGDDDHSPIVTIPGSTVVKNSDGSAGLNALQYEVYHGQAIYDKDAVLDASGNVKTNFIEPAADVRLVQGDKVIYTDVATAINTLSRSGDEVVLLRDTALVEDATVRAGVTLVDDGYALDITDDTTLTIEGTFLSTKESDILGNIVVKNGGVVKFDGNGYVLAGSITVEAGGIVIVGENSTAVINGIADGAIYVAGSFEVKNPSTVDVFKTTVVGAGHLTVGTTATYTVRESLVIGEPPTLLTNLANDAQVTGKVTLDAAAYVLAYGDSTFLASNLTNTSVSTAFQIADLGNEATSKQREALGENYAVIYADALTLETIVYQKANELKDFKLLGWFYDDSLQIRVNPNALPVIGADATLYGQFEAKKYLVTFSYHEGVNWIVNGVGQGNSKAVEYNYGTTLKVHASVLPGYTGTPVLTVNGGSYSADANWEVTADATFAANADSVKAVVESADTDEKLGLIEILLIIIVIIIGIIMIIVAIKLLRS
ncbi:MAG: hypothetical protein LBT41_00115 [Candidatus Methanoplasma sp.]|jgi:hypothetical protein|nr:hypothetical protein [Candidatus Methanoplasma sp.]